MELRYESCLNRTWYFLFLSRIHKTERTHAHITMNDNNTKYEKTNSWHS